MTVADPEAGRTDQAELDKAAGRPEDADQWTARLRTTAVDALPPQRLLPDRQPAYVASWIYVFGVVTVSALIVVIVTGWCWPSWARPGGTSRRPACSSTPSTCGASRSSSSPWSCTCGASSSWPPGVVGARRRGSPAWCPSWCPWARPSPATCPSRTSTPSGSAPRPRTGSTPPVPGAIFNVTNFGQMLMWHITLLPLCVVPWSGSTCSWSASGEWCPPSRRQETRPPPASRPVPDGDGGGEP